MGVNILGKQGFNPFYSQYNSIEAPEEYGLPKGARFITRVKGQTSREYPMSYIDLTQLRAQKGVQNARHSIVREFEKFDSIRLTNEEWDEVLELEKEHHRELPLPFTREALTRGFVIETDDEELLVYRRSNMPPFTFGDREIYPMVDSIIKPDGDGVILSGMGFVSVVKGELYSLVTYSFGRIAPSLVQSFSVSLYGYFHAQWVFHICPERLIEIPPGAEDPFVPTAEEQAQSTEPPTPAKPRKVSDRPTRITIARRIYLRDSKKAKRLKKMERRCRCWYVRGHWRTNRKTGAKTWIEGYFKGPDRNNADAKASAKSRIYVY